MKQNGSKTIGNINNLGTLLLYIHEMIRCLLNIFLLQQQVHIISITQNKTQQYKN